MKISIHLSKVSVVMLIYMASQEFSILTNILIASDLLTASMGRCNLPRLLLFLSLFLLVAVLLPSVLSAEDFYELLGIERDATAKDIRRAFKKLALSMHPDKNPVSTLKEWRFV